MPGKLCTEGNSKAILSIKCFLNTAFLPNYNTFWVLYASLLVYRVYTSLRFLFKHYYVLVTSHMIIMHDLSHKQLFYA